MSQGRSQRYDVVVVGGGAAGIAAAIGAQRAGARTLLVERYGFMGGAATNANVLSYCGFYARGDERRTVVGGAGARVLETLAELGFDVAPVRAPSGNWIVMLDPEALKYAMDRIVAEYGIDCRLHCTLIGARRSAARIETVTLFDHAGPFDVEAAAFVDASGDADLGFAAGVPALADPLSRRQRQLASFPVRIGGVPPHVNVSRAALLALMEHFGAGDARARVRRNGGHFLRLPRSNELWWMGVDWRPMASTQRIWRQPSGADAISRGNSSSSCARRCRASRMRTSAPAARSSAFATAGNCKPVTALTGEDVLSGRTRDDGIACGCWPAEIHRGASGPTFQPIGGEGYYHVPLASIRALGVDNLWVGGRAIGCDELAYGSLRVMGTAFATGQAAGIAAARHADGGSAEDSGRIRQDLLQQGAIL